MKDLSVKIEASTSELSKALTKASKALRQLAIMAEFAAITADAINYYMRPIWIRQKELKHLRVKQYTLGLTFLEKNRMRGEVTTKLTTSKPEIGTND